MMNSFAEYFKECILSPRLEEVYQKYLLLKQKYKYSVFVEGYLDKKFYGSVLCLKINNTFKGDFYTFVCNGKKGVVDICNYLQGKDLINNNSKNIINIVDRDFDVLNNVECKLKDKITITKYYSLESYAFISKNLEIVLDYLNLNQTLKNQFFDGLNKYSVEILDYEALLSCSINDNILYISTDLLENAKITNYESMELDLAFRTTVNAKISSLNKNSLKKYCSEKNKLSMNYLFYRGHDLEKYFDYFMEYNNKKIRLRNLLEDEELVRKLQIELIIK